MTDLTERGFEMTPTGMVVPHDATLDECKRAAQTIGQLARATPWLLGDVILHSERAWGERYVEVAEASGLRPETLMTYVTVCRAIPPARRHPDLSFSAHRVVAPMKPREQTNWIKSAQQNKAGSKELALAVKAGVTPDALATHLDLDANRVLPPTVREAAFTVWSSSKRNGTSYEVPLGPMEDLRDALGAS